MQFMWAGIVLGIASCLCFLLFGMQVSGNPHIIQPKVIETPSHRVRFFLPGKAGLWIAFHADGRPVLAADPMLKGEELKIVPEEDEQ